MKYLGVSEDLVSAAEYLLTRINLTDLTNKENTNVYWNEVQDAAGCNIFH